MDRKKRKINSLMIEWVVMDPDETSEKIGQKFRNEKDIGVALERPKR